MKERRRGKKSKSFILYARKNDLEGRNRRATIDEGNGGETKEGNGVESTQGKKRKKTSSLHIVPS